MPPEPTRRAEPRPVRHVLRWAVRIVAGGLAAVVTILLLAGITLHWVILPHIDRWRPQLERHAGEALGVPLTIGAIALRTGGWAPAAELRDVTLHDAAGRPALVLPRVHALLGTRSLLMSISRLEPRLDQIVVDGARLDVRRDAAGRVFVAGIDLGGAGAGGDDDGAALDWLLRQREIAVRGATVRWTDEMRSGAAPLELRAVDIVLRNGVRRHAMRLDATPPEALGERFTLQGDFRQPLLARPSEWRRWSGSVHALLPRTDAAELGRHVELPLGTTRGEGALRAWLDVRDGRVEGATADVSLLGVHLQPVPDAEPLALARAAGRVVGSERAGRGTFALHGFEFVTADGLHWPAGDLRATWTRDTAAPGAPLAGGSLAAGRIDLAVMEQIAGRLPLGERLRALLAETRPGGVVTGLQAEWEGPSDAPRRWRVQASASALTVASRPAADPQAPGRPGLRNADVTLTASERGGEAGLAMKGGAIDLPGLLAEPLVPLDRMQAKLRWRSEPRTGAAPALSVTVTDAVLANADVQLAFGGSWQSGSGPDPGSGSTGEEGRGARFPGRLRLDGTLRNGRAVRIARYLPLGLPEEVRGYVGRAVRAGTLRSATFRIDGDLADFPVFRPPRPGAPPSGDFRFAGRIEGVTLDYAPAAPDEKAPWPVATQVTGELAFDRASMTLRDASGILAGLALGGVRGGIADMTAEPVLALEGRVAGPLAAMLRFVDATPVGGWIHGALHPAAATGDAALALAIALPLDHLDRSTARGSLQLAGNELRLRPDLPTFSALRGRVDFTEKGVALAGVTAQVLGGEAALGGGTQADGSLRFTAQGTATADALLREAGPGVPSRLAAVLGGQTGYRLDVGFAGGLPEIELTSSLVGLGSALPAPLAKAPQTALPLRVTTVSQPRPAGEPRDRDMLQVDLGGTLLRARYERRWPEGGEPRVLRGTAALGAAELPTLPAAGVHAQAAVAQLDADAWQALLVDDGGGAAGGGVPGGGAAAAEASGGYAPTQLAVRAGTLVFSGRRLTHVVLGATLDDGAWLANITADQLEGHIAFRPGGAGRVAAHLSRLTLPKGEEAGVDALFDRPSESLPGLDVRIDALELAGRRLGRAEVRAVNRQRDWELTRFTLTTPDALFSASGTWAAPRRGGAGTRRTEIDFRLDIADAGALLDRLGLRGAIAGGQGRMDGHVAWPGAPLAPEPKLMSGRFAIAVDKGRFLKVEPGAARLLSVLSLQSLPRRLSLDFRDVFGEGFAFDDFGGDVTIERGVARTNNLRMRGAQAAVFMEGTADLARETQDLHVVVVPEINAGTASLALAVINPAVGLGTFLAQLVLRKPLIAAGTREFRVSGSWDDPQVERLERREGD